MGLRIRTNITSINAQGQLAKSTQALRKSMSKLSSGQRITKSADDAAGLAISENLKASIRSLDVAKRNASDGISLLQTAEGGLMETSSMLIRLRELAIQSASDTIGDRERGYLNQEYVQLKDEIDRIAASTEFNGTYLLAGEAELPGGIEQGSQFPLEIQVAKDYHEGADSLDAKNPTNIIRIDLQRINGFTEGDGSLGIGRAEEGTNVATKTSSQQSIATLDTAINRVNEYRAFIGAAQNRLTSSVSNLAVRIENLSESNSRIRDTDFASETARLTQSNIMQQAGTAVLATANTQPQIALSLLSQ